MPSMVAPDPDATIIIDTSGSMSKQDLAACLAETRGILDVISRKVTVYSVDAAVHKRQSVYSPSEIELIGGGGTDMREGLRVVNEEGAAICIVLTDLYTPWPTKKPPRIGRVIICGIKSIRYGKPQPVPKWAKYVEIEHDE